MTYLLLILGILSGLMRTGNTIETLFPLMSRNAVPLAGAIRPVGRAGLLPAVADGCEMHAGGLSRIPSLRDSPELADLPLVEIPSTTSADGTCALILSGDGGWAEIDRELGKVLANHGIPVVGWNTLKYFWTPRSPEQASLDLERILKHCLRCPRTQRVILIGYSFGADVLPFLVDLLPTDLKERIVLIALLGPGKKAEFEFHLGNWIGWISSDALPVLPKVANLKGIRILCVAGKEESDSLCRDLEPSLARKFVLPGGHHFGGNYDAIAKEILVQAEEGRP